MKGYISHGIENSNKSCSKQRANHRGKCALECLYSWLSVGAIGWSLANEIIQHLPLSRKTLGIRIHSEAPFLLSVDVGFDDLQVCADPGVPENGFRTPSGGVFFESSVTRFHCQDGFKLKGSTKRLCMKHLNGTLGWIPSDRPVCVQEGKVLTTPHRPPRKPLMWSACMAMTTRMGDYVLEGAVPGAARSASGLTLHPDRRA